MGLFFGSYILMLVLLSITVTVCLLTCRVRHSWYRIFLRAFAVSFCFTPFIPRRSMEWSSPWPPAGISFLLGLEHGEVLLFDLVAIILVGLVVGLGGMAIYSGREYHLKHLDGGKQADDRSTTPSHGRT